MEMKNRKYFLSSLSLVALSVIFIVGRSLADLPTHEWTNAAGDNLWSNSGNWEPGEVPTNRNSGHVEINKSGEDRAIIDYDHGWIRTMFVGHGAGNAGELDVTGEEGSLQHTKGGKIYDRGVYVGYEGGNGTINFGGGYRWYFYFGALHIGEGESSVGTVNHTAGEVFDMTVRVGRNGGTGLLNIEGGSWGVRDGDVRSGSAEIHEGGILRVSGSGADAINFERQFELGGTLEIRLDDEGVTPVEVHDSGGGEDGHVIFESGARLDVDWLERSNKNVKHWDVMTWDGELTDRGLEFAEGVDENEWIFKFVDTDRSGKPDTLRVYAVGEKVSDNEPLYLNDGEEATIIDTRTLPYSRIGLRGSGRLAILRDADVRLASQEGEEVIIGVGEGNHGGIHQYEGTVEIGAGDGLRLGRKDGSGSYQLTGGSLNMSERGRIVIGESGGGSSEFYIAGGRLENLEGVEVGADAAGVFSVSGSEITRLRTGSWNQGEQGILHAHFDAEDKITPVEVTGDVTFEDGARLKLSAYDVPSPGSRDVMTWSGELTDRGLTMHPDVNTDIWSFSFVDTSDDGREDTLRVHASPDALFSWPMWRYDAARSADPPFAIPEKLHLQWVRELPEPQRAWPFQWDDRGKLDFDVSYTPVVMNERIFVPSNVTDSVTAYHIEDGRELWRFYADGPVRLAPVAWSGRVYFTSDDGYLYCVDAESGELDWKFLAGPSDQRLLGNERIINFRAARGGPVIKDGTVYFAAGVFPLHGVFIYALDATTGEVEWVNDSTSSDYVALPHGGADGFGGLSPQGYIAASGDKLVVASGRGQSPVYLDRRTGEMIDYRFRGGKGGGGYAVHAVGEGGLGMRRNSELRERVNALSEDIDGEVFYQLATHDRLFLTTEDGELYCFGPEENEITYHEYEPASLRPRADEWSETAANLLERLGENEGYALILGLGSGDLLRELLSRSDLHVVVVEDGSKKVRALREELVEAGMYGRRAAVIEADPVLFSVQPYLFSLVVSEDMDAAGFHDVAALAFALDRLRPYGGTAWFGNVAVEEAAVERALNADEVDGVSVGIRDDVLLARRDGPLPGAGQWTHQHHDPANTLLSRDSRVRLPLGVLWFGGPNNHDILPRHSGGPRPQVADGRQVYLGVETIAARCVYTGRRLWEREFPGIGHPFTNLELEKRWAEGEEVYMSNIPGATYIGSPFVTLPDAIYLRYEGEILRLDPATGETSGSLKPPGHSTTELYGDDAPDWGHLSVQGDYLITTSEPHLFEDQELGWTDSWSGTSSRRIAVFNRHDGRLLWQREARVGFRHNAIVSDNDTLYLIDGLSEKAVEFLSRRGEEPKSSSALMALDLDDGDSRWRTESKVFGTYLLYSAEHDVLIEGGSRDLRHTLGDEPRSLTARRGGDGSILWEKDSFLLPGAVRGEMLIPGRPGNAISILNGENWSREQPLTGLKEDWRYSRRYGCNTLNASQNVLMYRSGYAGFLDLEHDSGTGNFSGFRSGCTPNLIAADGVVNALDYTRTCTCSYALQTSLALVHMPDDPNIEFWTRYDAARPDPRGHGVNFGAPGRRVDVAGTGRTWHHREGGRRRHPSVIEDSGDSLSWVLASALEVETDNSIRIEDVIKGEYTVQLHFAELDSEVEPGDRVFDVRVNGEKVLSGFDIVAAADGLFRGVVRAGRIEVGHSVEIELRSAEGSKLPPMINGMELIRN